MRSLQSIALAIVVLVACGPLGNERPTAAQRFDSATAREMERIWRQVAPDAGGYEGLEDLLTPPSLYATSWNLQIVAQYHIVVPNLSPDATAQWILDAVDSDATTRDLSSPLTRWNLAARALKALDRPIPESDVSRALSMTRTGILFSPRPGEPASWPATLWAVELMDLIGVQVDLAITDAVAADLASATRNADDRSLLNVVIPIWRLADRLLPLETRAGLRDPLRAALFRAYERATSGAQPDAVSLGILFDIENIAAANGIALPPVPRDFIEGLRSPSGYLALGPGDPATEPQATFYAAKLGVPPTGQLIESVKNRAGKMGWRSAFADVDPSASFYGLQLMHALGKTHRDSALRALTRRWLDQVSSATPSALNEQQLRGRFFVVALAKELGINVPVPLRATIERALRTELEAPTDDRAARRIVWLVRAAGMLDLPKPPLSGPAAEWVRTLSLKRMDEAYRAKIVADYFGSTALAAAANERIRSSKADGSTYVEEASAKWPDLSATCAGVTIAGGSRLEALQPFESENGPLMQPAASPLTPWLSPQTVYLGLVLLERVHDPDLCYE